MVMIPVSQPAGQASSPVTQQLQQSLAVAKVADALYYAECRERGIVFLDEDCWQVQRLRDLPIERQREYRYAAAVALALASQPLRVQVARHRAAQAVADFTRHRLNKPTAQLRDLPSQEQADYIQIAWAAVNVFLRSLEGVLEPQVETQREEVR